MPRSVLSGRRKTQARAYRQKAPCPAKDGARDGTGLPGIHHDLFSSEAELQASGKVDAAEKWLREHDLVYDGELEAPKGKTPDDWEPVALPLFRSTKLNLSNRS